MSPEWIRACPLIDQLNAALAGRHSLQLDIGCCGAGTVSLAEVLKHCARLSTTQGYTHVNAAQLSEVYRKAHPRAKND